MEFKLEIDEELLRAVEYCEQNGLKEAADHIKATIPFMEFGIIFRMAKQLNKVTHALEYKIEACYNDEEMPNNKFLPRRAVIIEAMPNERVEIPFYRCIEGLTADICNRAIERINESEKTE